MIMLKLIEAKRFGEIEIQQYRRYGRRVLSGSVAERRIGRQHDSLNKLLNVFSKEIESKIIANH